MTSGADDGVTIRPGVISRVLFWFGTGVAGLLALATASQGIEGIVPTVAALVMVGLGVGHALARVTVSPSGLSYRHFRQHHVRAEDIVDVRLGPGSGFAYPRTAIWIDQMSGGSLRLTILQQPSTAHGRRRLEEHVHAIRQALRLL